MGTVICVPPQTSTRPRKLISPALGTNVKTAWARSRPMASSAGRGGGFVGRGHLGEIKGQNWRRKNTQTDQKEYAKVSKNTQSKKSLVCGENAETNSSLQISSSFANLMGLCGAWPDPPSPHTKVRVQPSSFPTHTE